MLGPSPDPRSPGLLHGCDNDETTPCDPHQTSSLTVHPLYVSGFVDSPPSSARDLPPPLSSTSIVVDLRARSLPSGRLSPQRSRRRTSRASGRRPRGGKKIARQQARREPRRLRQVQGYGCPREALGPHQEGPRLNCQCLTSGLWGVRSLTMRECDRNYMGFQWQLWRQASLNSCRLPRLQFLGLKSLTHLLVVVARRLASRTRPRPLDRLDRHPSPPLPRASSLEGQQVVPTPRGTPREPFRHLQVGSCPCGKSPWDTSRHTPRTRLVSPSLCERCR